MGENSKSIDYTIGKAEAWDERERTQLKDNFLEIDQFSKISQPGNTFLCGRRGSGKSAIALMLECEGQNRYREAIQGELSEYGAYIDIVAEVAWMRDSGVDINIKQVVRRLWLWAIPVKAMQTIVSQTKKAGEPFDRDVDIMNSYLNSLPPPLHADSRIGDFLSHTFRAAYNLLKDSITAFNSFLINLTGSEEFHAARDALHNKTKSDQVLLVFDTLESYKIFQHYMIEGLQGVLEALVALNADKRLGGVSIKFFLPAEIFDRVFAGFPGKVQSRAVFLRWRTPDLISMLARRFLRVLIRSKSIPENDIRYLTKLVDEAYKKKDGRKLKRTFWYSTKFLPEKITNKQGIREDCFAFMFRHTQRRPRDIISQFQCILDKARKEGEFPQISEESVNFGVHNDLTLIQILGDALAPYEGSIPTDLISAARSTFYERPRIMSGRELKRFSQELYNLHPLKTIDPDLFLHHLLFSGVIGKIDKEQPDSGKREIYCTAKFEYIMAGNLPLADRFVYGVHPVMGDLFKMPHPENRGHIYPMPDSAEDRWLEEEAGIT